MRAKEAPGADVRREQQQNWACFVFNECVRLAFLDITAARLIAVLSSKLGARLVEAQRLSLRSSAQQVLATVSQRAMKRFSC